MGCVFARPDESMTTATPMCCIKCGKDCFFATFSTYEGMIGPMCDTCFSLSTSGILPMVEGCDTSRKTELLLDRLTAVLNEEQFGDVTAAEVIGTLEILKQRCLQEIFQ